MTTFDESQLRVLGLDPRQHARIVGAPGSGKTRVIVETFATVMEREGWGEDDVLILAPNRLAATALRADVDRRVERALGGTPVRTAASLAFAVLTREAALEGRTAPRLLTGTVQDEACARVVADRIERGQMSGGFAPDVMLTEAFRTEVRELGRIVDDFGLRPEALIAECERLRVRGAEEAVSAAPAEDLLIRWAEGAAIAHAAEHLLRGERPHELSSSGMLQAGSAAIAAGRVHVPRLILVDDAQDVGEGQLAVLAACAVAGSAVWVFGDPDLATGAFQGERSRVLAGLTAELERREPSLRARAGGPEQLVVLEQVHRHGPGVRGFIREITDRIGVAGGAAHRSAAPRGAAHTDPSPRCEDTPKSRPGGGPRSDGTVEFAVAGSTSEQLGIIAHRMRSRHLGLGERVPMQWREMAVVCRSRGEATRIARLLAGQQVPTGIAAGGIVLREHQIVRELIRLLQHAMGLAPLDAHGVLQLVGGVLGGLDPVAVRRLRGTLLIQERREARAEERAPGAIDELVFDAFMFPGAHPVIDSAGGRAIRKLGRMAAAAVQMWQREGTPRETLWALWERAQLADRWQQDALEGRGLQADEANRSLDAVMGLFFALQRHEEQDSEQPISELLEDLLENTLPEDSLARRSEGDRVTVTTPQGVLGQEFGLVAVVGLQDGSWPNLRARGSLLGTSALERWLRGGLALPPTRRDTIHDELRLLAHTCSRAIDELLVVAVADEEQHPSPFFGLGARHRVDGLPSSRLTLRGVTAAMRRRLVADPNDTEAIDSLALLAQSGVPGAHPDEWYGVAPVSSSERLFAAGSDDGDPLVPVSPSQLETAENCALDWVIGVLGGGRGNVHASLGTLVHHALETADGTDPDQLLDAILTEWGKLPFDAEWEAERARRTAASMARGLSEYLRAFAASGRELVGRESSFSLPVGQAMLRGQADRLERTVGKDGIEITVVDLKTGRTPVSGPAAESHVQLQAYQLGVALGAFDALSEHPEGTGAPVHTRAKLLYVHPDAAKGKGFVERVQPELSAEARAALMERVTEVAEIMAAREFTARVEHHCSDPHAPGNCRLHIIPAVSHA